jgi:hypothetical protein
VALAFGLVIGVMIYALRHISGAHFNPAVSIGFAVGRHMGWRRAATHAGAQIAGAIRASIVLRLTLGPTAHLDVTHLAGSDLQAFAWECVLTFFLMLVITAVATDNRAVGNAAALAIGGVVALGALVGGSISGASTNPARSMAPALVSGDLGASGSTSVRRSSARPSHLSSTAPSTGRRASSARLIQGRSGPTSARASAGRVVRAVAGHRHETAVGLLFAVGLVPFQPPRRNGTSATRIPG